MEFSVEDERYRPPPRGGHHAVYVLGNLASLSLSRTAVIVVCVEMIHSKIGLVFTVGLSLSASGLTPLDCSLHGCVLQYFASPVLPLFCPSAHAYM